ncbi:tetratricopeptide repeat protein [Desulfomicrobium apsheronum]|nr:tetratricopeptide repeat protein [Desulfomicrobium apsheronum]
MSHKLIRKEIAPIYDRIVINFLQNQNGAFFIVTNDDIFVRTMRGALRTMGLNYDSMTVAHASSDIGKKCREILDTSSQVVMFIESKINGRSNVFDFKSLKDVFRNRLKIICITPEVSEEYVSFIAENDVDSIIVKPISINNIIQKIAFTIKPSNMFHTEVENIRELIEKEQYEDADSRIDMLLEEKPGSSICMVLKGDIARKNEKFKDAEFFYKEAVKESRLNLKPLQKLADLYWQINDPKEYTRYLLLMDKISPLNHKRKISIGEQYSKDGQEDMARKFYQDAVSIVRSQANDMLASTLMDIGVKLREINPEQSIQFMNQALETKGSDITREDLWMVNEMGVSLRKKGDWKGAVQTYQQALAVIPNEGGLHYNMGMAYAQGKEHYKAVCEFEKAISASPDLLQESPLIPFNIGMVYFQMNRLQEVERFMKAALKCDPNFERAKTMLEKIGSSRG